MYTRTYNEHRGDRPEPDDERSTLDTRATINFRLMLRIYRSQFINNIISLRIARQTLFHQVFEMGRPTSVWSGDSEGEGGGGFKAGEGDHHSVSGHETETFKIK